MAVITQQRIQAQVAKMVQALQRVQVSIWRQILIFILLAWCCLNLGRLVWFLVPVAWVSPAPSEQGPVPQLMQTTDSSAKPKSDVIDIEQIKSLHLFGALEQEDVVAEPEPLAGIEQQAVESKLSIVLNGVIDSDEPSDARAIITDGGRQAMFAPGESLPVGNGVKLAKVLADRIIIDNRGQYETVWLYTEGAQATTSFSRTPVRAQASPVRPPPPMPEVAGVNAHALPGVDENASKVLNDILKVSLHRDGGQIVGYRVRPGRDRRLFDQVGLKPNDIVTSVDGVAVQDPAQAMKLYQNMRQKSSVQLELLRDGQPIALQVELNEQI